MVISGGGFFGRAGDRCPPAEGRSTDMGGILTVKGRPREGAPGCQCGGKLSEWCHIPAVLVPGPGKDREADLLPGERQHRALRETVETARLGRGRHGVWKPPKRREPHAPRACQNEARRFAQRMRLKPRPGRETGLRTQSSGREKVPNSPAHLDHTRSTCRKLSHCSQWIALDFGKQESALHRRKIL